MDIGECWGGQSASISPSWPQHRYPERPKPSGPSTKETAAAVNEGSTAAAVIEGVAAAVVGATAAAVYRIGSNSGCCIEYEATAAAVCVEDNIGLLCVMYSM